MLALIMLPLAVLICVERATGRNIFSVFGGCRILRWCVKADYDARVRSDTPS
jgi:hypothetical protein